MAADLIVSPEAEEDLDAAYSWYEGRQLGPGERFLISVDSCVQFICDNPESYPTVHKHYRRAIVRKFPFSIFYEYADRVVKVHCVFHSARDPRKWRGRLP